ncbi:MAG: OprD family outer membrane porin [Campylobacterota bacterium]|nr:OprD family outer membrane porin [Campylobacterota bacterium]
MRAITLSMLATSLLLVGTNAHALKTEKRDLANNMKVKYNVLPKDASNLQEMFTNGEFYGRLRSNMFVWDWDHSKANSTENNRAWGVGGSFIYKTAHLYGLGATVGFYTTQTIGTDNTDPRYPGKDFGKAGKDTYSRADGSGSQITVIAQAYLEYKLAKSSLKYGRQGFDSKLLATNDTKMIPNTFMGTSLVVKDIPDTKLRAAYFTQQKLRDHREFHSVIAYDGWNENDDAGVHKGMTIANITSHGANINPGMLVLTGTNKSIKNLKIDVDYMYLADFVSSIIPEVNYKIPFGSSGWSLTPGARYFKQFDNGGGAIGGAALSGKLAGKTGSQMGYKDANSVEGSMWAARLVLAQKAFKFSAGYSAVGNEADLIAPWRGFPTGGYTRSMAQYNWEANTKSWMLKAYYDFGKANIIPGFRTSLDYASMDYDNDKLRLGSISKTDRSILHLDMWQTFSSVKNLELKLRAARVFAEGNEYSTDTMDYTSYTEGRFEVNYLF